MQERQAIPFKVILPDELLNFNNYIPIEELKEKLDKIEEYIKITYPFRMQKILISFEIDSDGRFEGLSVDAYRWEFDGEMKKRIALNRKRSRAAKASALKRKIGAEERRRRLWEKLKKEFGG